MKFLSPNTLLQDRYLIVHLIGRGGMGEVYLAIDQRLGSAVALKRTSFSDDPLLGSAFEREAKTLARLRHNALPKVSDHFLEDGKQYLIMEFIAGDDLAKRLESSKKPFPLAWVMFWADGLLDALHYLHSNEPPIIHRDIKPQNLKLTEENSIVLLDFGLSKNTLDAVSQTSANATTGSSVVGYTPHYAPLEQIRGTGTNARSDIYSLSATIYQLLTNVVPPDALTRAEAVLGGKPDPLQPLNEMNAEVSPAVSEIISNGMEISRDKRFAGARQMQTALRDAYSQKRKQVSAASESTRGDDVSVDFPSQPLLLSNEVSQTRTSRNDKISTPPTRIDFDGDGFAAETRPTSYSMRAAKDFSTRTEAAATSAAATTAADTDAFATFTATGNSASKDSSSNEHQSANKEIKEKPAPNSQKSLPERKSAPAPRGQKSSRKSLLVPAGVGAFCLLIAIFAAAAYLLNFSTTIDKSAATSMPAATPENTPVTAAPSPIIEAAADKLKIDANSVSSGETISNLKNANSNRETAEKSFEKPLAGKDNIKAVPPVAAKVNSKPPPPIGGATKQSTKAAAAPPKALPTLPRILP